jgi:hypothetical protein
MADQKSAVFGWVIQSPWCFERNAGVLPLRQAQGQSGSCKCIAAILLFCFVLFEEFSCFFEGEGVSVDLEFVSAGVVRDGDDIADSMAVLAECLDDEIDVYHG